MTNRHTARAEVGLSLVITLVILMVLGWIVWIMP